MAYSVDPLPRYASLDGFAVALLTAIALAGLQPTFDGWNWVAVAALGMAVGLGWAYGLALLRLGPVMVGMTLFIPYVLTAGALALGRWGKWGGLPDAATLEKVVTGTADSWAQFVGTLPPLDSEGQVMLIPFLLAMTAGSQAGSMAITSPRPSLPALPLVALLGGALVLGTAEPFSVLLQGLGFGAVVLLWIGHRSARTAASLGSLRRLRGRLPVGPRRRRFTPMTEAERRLTTVSAPRTLASVLCVALAVAIVLPLASSTPERTRWVLREALPAYDSSTTTSPLTVFRSFRPVHEPSVGNSVLFTVDGAPRGALLRIAVLDGYNGTNWYAVPDREDDLEDRFVRISSQITNPGQGRRAQALVEVRHSWLLDWLPVVGQPQSIEFLRDPDHDRRDAVRFNRSTDAALTVEGLVVGDSYLVSTRLPKDTLTSKMKHYPVPDWQLYADAEFLDAAVNMMSDRTKEPMTRLFQLADWLYVSGRYSDGAGWEERFPKGHDRDRLGPGFVTAPQIVGNDEQYAATMALMANRLAIPARVVVGAEINSRGEVRGRDVHAWVEVRVKDGSWRRLPTETFMSDTPPDLVDPPKPSWPKKWNQQQPDTPEEIKRKERQRREEEEKQEEAKRREERRPFYFLGLVPVLAVGAVPVAKLVRRRRRGGQSDPDAVALAGWAEVVDTAEDLGYAVPRRPRPEQARALGVDEALARWADVAAFTDQAPAVDRGQSALVRQASADLRARAPRVRRWLAPFNPRSLFRRGPR